MKAIIVKKTAIIKGVMTLRKKQKSLLELEKPAKS
jgi:hypothetical protein